MYSKTYSGSQDIKQRTAIRTKNGHKILWNEHIFCWNDDLEIKLTITKPFCSEACSEGLQAWSITYIKWFLVYNVTPAEINKLVQTLFLHDCFHFFQYHSCMVAFGWLDPNSKCLNLKSVPEYFSSPPSRITFTYIYIYILFSTFFRIILINYGQIRVILIQG